MWRENDGLFVLVKSDVQETTGRDLHRVLGTVKRGEGDALVIKWQPFVSAEAPVVAGPDIHLNLPGSSLAGYAFDRAVPGLGMWVVTLAAWLFAVSTIISWSYYGEQACMFLFGNRSIVAYKVIYCLAILLSTIPGLVETDAELDSFTALGTGVMLWANIPIMLIFGPVAMRAYRDYMRKLESGQMKGHALPPITDVVEGKDVR